MPRPSETVPATFSSTFNAGFTPRRPLIKPAHLSHSTPSSLSRLSTENDNITAAARPSAVFVHRRGCYGLGSLPLGSRESANRLRRAARAGGQPPPGGGDDRAGLLFDAFHDHVAYRRERGPAEVLARGG